MAKRKIKKPNNRTAKKTKTTKKKPVRSKPRQRRDTVRLVSRRVQTDVGNASMFKDKSTIRISFRKSLIRVDSTIKSNIDLRDKLKEWIDNDKIKKYPKLKKDSTGILRIVFHDVHKEDKKLRKKNNKKYNVKKKHDIAVSTSLVQIKKPSDLLSSFSFLIDFLQSDIERYIKYTQNKREFLTVDYVELLIYENGAKKNQNRSKIKKRVKKIRNIRRRK